MLNPNAVLDAYNILIVSINENFELGIEKLRTNNAIVYDDIWDYILDSIERRIYYDVKAVLTYNHYNNPSYIKDFMMIIGEMLFVLQDGKVREVKSESIVNSIKERIIFLSGGEIRVWVNVYHITREYGGPEEGGWYYNWRTLVEAHNLNINDVHARLDELKEKHGEGKGDISSVLGGYQVMILIEGERGESQDTKRPYYC